MYAERAIKYRVRRTGRDLYQPFGRGRRNRKTYIHTYTARCFAHLKRILKTAVFAGTSAPLNFFQAEIRTFGCSIARRPLNHHPLGHSFCVCVFFFFVRFFFLVFFSPSLSPCILPLFHSTSVASFLGEKKLRYSLCFRFCSVDYYLFRGELFAAEKIVYAIFCFEIR